jgi:hypothetical protein
MLTCDEAGTDVLTAERTLDCVEIECPAIDVDSPPVVDLLHAGSLGVMAAPKGRTKIASETKTLKVGDAAPDFTLRAHDGREIKLLAFRGQRVVLAFFAFAFSNT